MEPRVCESSRTSWSSWPHWKPSTLFKANAPTPSNSAVACKVQVKLFPVPFGGGEELTFPSHRTCVEMELP